MIAALGEFRDARFNGRATKSEIALWKKHVRDRGYASLSHFLRLAAIDLIKRDSEESEAITKQAELDAHLQSVERLIESKLDSLKAFLRSTTSQGLPPNELIEVHVGDLLKVIAGPISWEDLSRVSGVGKEELMAALEHLFQEEKVEIDKLGNWQIRRQ